MSNRLLFQGRVPLGRTLFELRRAVDVLCAQAAVDPARIGVIGHSAGGFYSALAMYLDDRIKAGCASCGTFLFRVQPHGRGRIYSNRQAGTQAGAGRAGRRWGHAASPRGRRLRVDGREEPVRLIGINTPESVDPRRPVECLGKEASAKTAELLKGVQTVEVEADPTQDARDAHARLLLYVWLPGGRLLNRELIASGYAHEYTFRAPDRFQAECRQAQREAEAAGRGLWAPGACENQAPVGRPTPAPAKPAPSTVAPSAPKPTAAPQVGRGVPPVSKDDCPASHPIKGNQGSRSTTDWIYHPPGSRSYAATDPEECFATAADAEATGYRAPRN